MKMKTNARAHFVQPSEPRKRRPTVNELARTLAVFGAVGTIAVGLLPIQAVAQGTPPVEIDGYVDAAYSRLSEGGVFTSGGANRVFDTEPDSFNLHQAALFATINPDEEWGGFVNLTAGRDARIIKSFDTSTNDFDVTQAYVRYGGEKTTFIAGKFVTLAGAEVIDSRALPAYSRSILFGYAIPFAHTGVRASFAFSDAFGLSVGLNNGWDQMKDVNDDKTLEVGIAVTPSDVFSLYAQVYSGKEGFPSATRDLIDVVMNINASDRLGFTFNYDTATQDGVGLAPDADWSGWAAYLKYAMSDEWRLLLRVETFDDEDGFRTGVVQEWDEFTVAFAYTAMESAEIRFEVRSDSSNVASFVSENGLTVGDDQNSIGVEFLYKF
jgi:putative OmpL-like beta-barrel porin-2